MARNLPWIVNPEQPVKKARATPTPRLKQEKLSSPAKRENVGEDNPVIGRGRVSMSNATPKSNVRTPSSSPVRGPPPEQTMREGYDRDDNFIMVEDEFYTVAQSYTAHLHHAEYKRLVRQAQQAPPKALPQPSSPMSKQTKDRLKAAALAKRQKQSVRKVTGSKRSDDDADVKVEDLWSGTNLGSLMVNASQEKTSLIGSEGISSSSKAGLGISRHSQARKESKDGRDGRMPKSASNEMVVVQQEVSTTKKPELSQGKTPSHRDETVRASPVRTNDSSIQAPQVRSSIKKTIERAPVKRKFVFDDGFDEPEMEITNEKATQKASSLGNGKSFLVRKSTKQQEKKRSRLDEVPLFIP